MNGERTALPVGTTVKLDGGSVYQIVGKPFGYGGGSILYPAQKLLFQGDTTQTDGFEYALKECFPASIGHPFYRNSDGSVAAYGNDPEDLSYLRRAQLLQMAESTVSQKVYRTSSRMLPIREASQNILLTLPQHEPVFVSNTFTVMDSLTEKGRSLSAWISERKRFAPAEAFRIIQNVLLALQEVHQAGYLHLDIQDGNIFLRGTLKSKSELVTLIDFGCARVYVDGKTAPIQDRVIFTTPGFSAPEILQCNDGTLQLGPEADLYSVGCLALYLLTGQRPDSRILLANRTGLYLKPNQLRKMNCPPHLIGRMQEIIARALEKMPQQRYHCAEQMLKDVTDLADALQPYRTDLSGVVYDAFICYKHGQRDTAAALALQRTLENYHAPKAIAAKRKPFGKVFVDEGELSSCSDFGQQIREALKNSGWLIVICSPDTSNSPWVQLEIETFLEYHDRSRILAVLTDGDEDCSFPPQLKADDVHHAEVFAADARAENLSGVLKKLRKDALLRLAAPMLGTTFDSLKQRQRLYQLKRLAGCFAVLFAATAGFAAYAVNRGNIIARQGKRIEQEYQRALINESRFLTEQAQKQLEQNNPLGAMELLLQALPSADEDRPVLPEAEYALCKALGIYRTPSNAVDTVSAMGIIDTPASHFFADSNATTLFTWDTEGNLQAWDALSLDVRWHRKIPSALYGAKPILYQDRTLALLTIDGIMCIHADDGTDKWTASIEDPIALAVSKDEKTVLVISGDQETTVTTRNLSISRFCTETGTLLQHNSFSIDGSQYVLSNLCISPDLQFAAIPTVDVNNRVSLQPCHSLYLADLTTGQTRLLFESQTEIQSLAFLDDHLALIRSSGYSLNFGQRQHYKPYVYQLELYCVETGDQVFSIESEDYMEIGGLHSILEAPYTADDIQHDGILYVYQDHCLLADRTQGNVIRQYTLPAPIVSLQQTENGFHSIHTNGSICWISFAIDTYAEMHSFENPISKAYSAGEFFFIQHVDEAAVYKYQKDQFDSSYTSVCETDGYYWELQIDYSADASPRIFLSGDNTFALLSLDSGKLQDVHFPEGATDPTLLGFSEDGNRAYWIAHDFSESTDWFDMRAFYCMDLVTGKVDRLPKPESPWPFALSYDDFVYADESIYFVAERFQDNQCDLLLCRWDLITGAQITVCEYTLDTITDQYEDYSYGSFQQTQNGSFCLGIKKGFFEPPTKWLCIDPATEGATEIGLDFVPDVNSEFYTNSLCIWNQDASQIIFTYGTSVFAVDRKGDLIYRIDAPADIVSLEEVPDGHSFLLTLSSGAIVKYCTATGEELARLQLDTYCDDFGGFYGDNLYWQTIDANTLLAVTEIGGFVLDISSQSLTVRAVVDQCIAYDPIEDRFLTIQPGEDTTIGSFHRYTIAELIQMAEAVIRN